MLTITFRHDAGGDLRAMLRGLLAAWRRTRQGGAIQELWGHKVSASVRATEVTHGMRHGRHPHIHVLLRCSKWSREERRMLFERWARAVVDELGDDARPTAAHGLDFTDVFDAACAPSRYLAKLGLELTGTAKEGRGGSRSPWQLAADASDGDPQSVKLWHDYVASTKGHQMIRLDDRAQQHARWWAFANAVATDGDGGPSCIREVDLWPEDVRALRIAERSHATMLDDILSACEQSEHPQEAARDWVTWAKGHAAFPLEDE